VRARAAGAQGFAAQAAGQVPPYAAAPDEGLG
jgi:hypothetical protein